MSGRLWRSVRACVESSAPSASAFPQALHANPLPSALREVKIETIDHTECVDDYSSLELTVTDRMFCGMGAGKDSCQVRRQAVTSVASPVGFGLDRLQALRCRNNTRVGLPKRIPCKLGEGWLGCYQLVLRVR